MKSSTQQNIMQPRNVAELRRLPVRTSRSTDVIDVIIYSHWDDRASRKVNISHVFGYSESPCSMNATRCSRLRKMYNLDLALTRSTSISVVSESYSTLGNQILASRFGAPQSHPSQQGNQHLLSWCSKRLVSFGVWSSIQIFTISPFTKLSTSRRVATYYY
jgi:hypothetical protein